MESSIFLPSQKHDLQIKHGDDIFMLLYIYIDVTPCCTCSTKSKKESHPYLFLLFAGTPFEA